jgi:hypothetical protein
MRLAILKEASSTGTGPLKRLFGASRFSIPDLVVPGDLPSPAIQARL